MRNLYRPAPRPGSGKRPLFGKGSKAYETRQQNNASDTGAGYVYALTGMGGLACDQIKLGQTRNHPTQRADTIRKKSLVDHWAHYREIEARHRSDPPQLWACPCPDRRVAAAAIHRLLVEDYFAREEAGDTSQPSLATILRVMEQVTGELPLRFSLIGT